MDQSKFFKLSARNQGSPGKTHAMLLSLARALVCLALIAYAATVFAQHTVVEKNGLAGTIETDYNAAGKAMEMRTIGTDGKLQQKVDYEYLPGYQVPQQTDTTYWPNGQFRKVARHTYDESANFTSEVVQIFDESGKQIAGHKLTHDPWSGAYRCFEWNAASGNYKDVACPSGEEGSGGNEEPKKFTYDEVMKHLDAARDAVRKAAKISATGDSSAGVGKEFGVVLPAHIHPGERVSGRMVENPDRYAEMPEVTVTRVAVPFESSGPAARLSGWVIETSGEEPRPADGPIAFIVPQRGSEMNVTFREAGNAGGAFSKTLNLSLDSASPSDSASLRVAEKSHAHLSFYAAALCMKDGLCAVSGPFSGDSSKTFAAFEDRPATIVAETSDTAYVSVPEPTEAGSRPLFIAEGAKVVAFPVAVGDFFIKNNGRELKAGETLITFPTLDGPGDIPDDAWHAGNFPATNLQRARQLIPGFELDGSECRSRDKDEAEEKREVAEKREKEKDEAENAREAKREEKEEGGRILLVVKNLAPEQSSLHSSKHEAVVFCLTDEAFQRGAFKYDLRIDARTAGKAAAKGYVIPFLAPVAGQEFSVKLDQP